MNRLAKISFFALFVASMTAVAQESCSLVVRVVGKDDIPLSGVRVIVLEASGIVSLERTAVGEARFCGLGVRPVEVKVGESTCNQVLVQNVPLSWNTVRELKVTYTRCPIEESSTVPLCSVLFRFRDQNEQWIPNVAFSPPPPRSTESKSDQFGRLMLRMARGEQIHLRTVHPGFLSEDLDLTCDRNLIGQERIMTLRKTDSVPDQR